MAEAVARGPVRAGFKPSFHLLMALLMSGFIFGGFGLTYIGPMTMGTMPPTPPVVHLHGAFYFGWMLLLILQTSLVNVRNVRLHRSLGSFGIAYAGALVVIGLLITIISTALPFVGPDDFGLMYLSFVAPVSFAVIFAMAIRAVRTPAVHRNLMLLATLAILMPGINRLYMVSLGLDGVPFYATYFTMDVMLAAILLHESKVTGSVTRPTWIAAAIIVVPQALLWPVAGSDWFMALCNGMGDGLVYYR